MKKASFLLRATSWLLLAAANGAFAASAPERSKGPALGQLDFPVTGSPECQRLFRQVGRMSRQATSSAAYVDEIGARADVLRARTPETERQALEAIAHSVKLAELAPIAGPAFFLTARERLAEALLAAGKHAEALAEYERVVEARPNRALSLLGAARAARAAGDASKERAHYRALADLWTEADVDLPVLAEVRAGAGGERRAAARLAR
jgi:tetratricopeptide (TPR) repeat protein